MYSAPFEVVPYTEKPFSHHWWTPQPPQIQRSLFNASPIAHTNIFAQLPKMQANETDQPSKLYYVIYEQPLMRKGLLRIWNDFKRSAVSDAIWWANIQLIQLAPPGGQICKCQS